MNNNVYEQEHLANFAPDRSLNKYKNGADDRVINGIMALSEMKDRAAERLHGNLAAGAAKGQMPTVRDKIMQMFQQANQPRQQPQQQPNPMAQGIMAQARPPMQTAPMPEAEEQPTMQARAGGLARLPVNDRMFGYANGGIIAFAGKDNDQEVPLPVGQETPLSPEERARLERELEMRVTGERARAGIPDEVPANLKNPSMNVTDFDFTSLPQMQKSQVLQKATEIAKNEGKPAPDNLDIKKALAFVSAPFAAAADVALSIPKGLQSLAQWSFKNPLEGKSEGPNYTSVMDARNAFLSEGDKSAPASAPTQTATVVPPQTGKPQLQGPRTLVGDAAAEHERLEKARENFISGQKTVGGMTYGQAVEAAREKNGGTLTREQLETINRRFAGATPDVNTAIKTLPVTGTTKPSTVPSTTTTQGQGQGQDAGQYWMDLMKKQYGTQPAGPTVEAQLAARDKYVENAPDSKETIALIQHLDKMAKRYEANDEAEKAQQAINARNNLWSFLSNTRGSSLGVAAGKADAALQPLLAAQETRRQTYQKQRDEQEAMLGKARYEAAAAERARKEGRYSDAQKHEQKERELTEQARGHNITGIAAVMRDMESQRHHKTTEEAQRQARIDADRRWQSDQQRRQDELEERIRNDKLRNEGLAKDLNKNIAAAKTKLSRLPKDSKDKAIVEMRTEQEELIRGWEQERKELMNRIHQPSGYDPSKVKKIGS